MVGIALGYAVTVTPGHAAAAGRGAGGGAVASVAAAGKSSDRPKFEPTEHILRVAPYK